MVVDYSKWDKLSVSSDDGDDAGVAQRRQADNVGKEEAQNGEEWKRRVFETNKHFFADALAREARGEVAEEDHGDRASTCSDVSDASSLDREAEARNQEEAAAEAAKERWREELLQEYARLAGNDRPREYGMLTRMKAHILGVPFFCRMWLIGLVVFGAWTFLKPEEKLAHVLSWKKIEEGEVYRLLSNFLVLGGDAVSINTFITLHLISKDIVYFERRFNVEYQLQQLTDSRERRGVAVRFSHVLVFGSFFLLAAQYLGIHMGQYKRLGLIVGFDVPISRQWLLSRQLVHHCFNVGCFIWRGEEIRVNMGLDLGTIRGIFTEALISAGCFVGAHACINTVHRYYAQKTQKKEHQE